MYAYPTESYCRWTNSTACSGNYRLSPGWRDRERVGQRQSGSWVLDTRSVNFLAETCTLTVNQRLLSAKAAIHSELHTTNNIHLGCHDRSDRLIIGERGCGGVLIFVQSTRTLQIRHVAAVFRTAADAAYGRWVWPRMAERRN